MGYAAFVIKRPRIVQNGARFYLGHPSNDAILAYCDTREEAEDMADALDRMADAPRAAADAAAFVQAILDTDALTVAMAQAGEEPLDAIDVAGVVDAILRGDKYRADEDTPVVRWARETFGADYFARVFEVQS